MISSLLFKKFVFFASTGTVLFYLISFNSTAEKSTSENTLGSALTCQDSVRQMNSGRVSTLRKDLVLNSQNVLNLQTFEMKAVQRFEKEKNLTSQNHPPLELTTYVFESSRRRALGYKVVLHTKNSSDEATTYFLNRNGDLLFTHWGGFIPTQAWNCESPSGNPTLKASAGVWPVTQVGSVHQ